MSSNLIVKPRRFRLTVWELDENLEPIRELDEVISFSANFALNQQPTAVFEPAYGKNVITDDTSMVLDDIDKLIKEKTPVGILVEHSPEPMHATTSVTNDSDEDCEKWPNNPVFIFKGHLSGTSFIKSSKEISMRVQITHWLADLSAVSMYSPRASISSPYQFAADLSRLGIKNPNQTLKGWNLYEKNEMEKIFNKTRGAVTNTGAPEDRQNTMWDCVLAACRSVVKSGIYQMDKCIFGKVDPRLLLRQDYAMKHFTSCLKYTDTTRKALTIVFQDILNSLSNTAMSTWVKGTVWDKVCGEFPSTFYYALAPTAGWCYVIPTPGTIPKDHIDIVQDEILQLYYSTPPEPILGAVVLSNSASRDSLYGKVRDPFNPVIYPPRNEIEQNLTNSVGGPIHCTELPDYLHANTILNPPLKVDNIVVTNDESLTTRPGMEDAKENDEAQLNHRAILAEELVALDFLSRVFSGRQLTFSTAFRGDIVPGAAVHLHAESTGFNGKSDKALDLYGIVSSVSISINSSSARTDYIMFNIRNKDEFESDLYNPNITPFYSEQFNGLDATLYCPQYTNNKSNT